MFNFLDKEGLMYLVLKIKKLIADANVKIATKDTTGIIKGGDNHIAEDGTLTLITETTETTMPNSCEGRLLFKEIRGKTEKLTSTGANLLNLRDGVNAVGDGVTYTNRGDGTYSRVGTATGITGNAWIKGGYVEGVPSTEITNPIMTLKLGKSYFIGDCVLFSVTKDGVSYGVTGAVTVQNEDAKIVGIRNTGQLVGHNYNDVIYPRVFEGLVDLGWEPYGVGNPFIRSAVISGIKTHGKNLFDYSKAVNGYITNDGVFSNHPYVIISDYIPSNGNVTVSLNKNVIAIAINCFDSSNNFISKNIFENCSVATLDTVENCEYIRVAITVDDSDLDVSRLLTYELMVNEGNTALPYEPYNVVTFSSPIELNEIGDVQDVIENNVIKRKYKKVILDGSSDEKWTLAAGVEQPSTFYCEISDAKRSATTQNALCNAYTFVDTIQTQLNNNECTMYHDLYNNYPDSNWIYLRDTSCANVSELRAKLQANPITVVYELATPTTEELLTADQVALNSINTFDGTTHLEFDSPLQPEFVAEYGTSKVGGVALEAKGESQANSENIEEMNSAMEAMNAILQNAFVPKGTTSFEGDINLCVESGIYRIGSGISNAPYGNGFLIVFAWLPNVLIQVNMSYLPSYTAVRTCWYGTWNPWYRITTTEIK